MAPLSLVDLLADARAGLRPPLDGLARGSLPASLDEAYAVQAVLAERRGPTVGWKVGATGPRGQQALGLANPFFGRIAAGTVHGSPAVWRSGGRPVTLDAEIVFELGEGGSVMGLRLAVEVNQPAYADPFALGGLAIIADNGANAGLVLGPALPLDTDLSAVTARLVVDGTEAMAGTGAAVLGDPRRALDWLLGELAARGLDPGPDPLVASGNICFAEVRPGSVAVADFGALGSVEVRVV